MSDPNEGTFRVLRITRESAVVTATRDADDNTIIAQADDEKGFSLISVEDYVDVVDGQVT